MDVAGRTALVTGASLGIGRATAVALAARGAHVRATGLEARPLTELTRLCGAAVIAADLSAADGIDKLLDWAGPVDILVNVAGFGRYERVGDIDGAGALEMLAVNLVAPIRLTAALAPAMVERGCGHIVNVASIAGWVGVSHEAVYAATKGGLIAFSESVRYELAGTGVGLTVVVPAAVETSFFARRGRAYERRFPRPVDPARVATRLVAAVERNAPEVFVPRWLVLPARLRGGLPSAYRRAAGRAMRE
jgi:short-subunit dehydrogenase